MAGAKGRSAQPLHVSIVAIPEAAVSTLTGIYDVLNAFDVLPLVGKEEPGPPPFRVEIVGENAGPLPLASRVPITVERPVRAVTASDVVIVPSLILRSGRWDPGRYPALVEWLAVAHARGGVLCSACSGLFLLGETGLFDGKDATVHYDYARVLSATYPAIQVHPERALVVSGRREELVTSGASMSWHDLVLYLIARYAGTTAAQAVARFFALQWHQEGLSPYIVFEGRTDHGDAAIRRSQQWLATHFAVARPVEEMVKRSGLAERTFKRRFAEATGLPPLAYVQRLRVEDAKRRLERTEAPIDEISWKVGYEDPTFFRRLFRRTTGLSPGAYRRRFRAPDVITRR